MRMASPIPILSLSRKTQTTRRRPRYYRPPCSKWYPPSPIILNFKLMQKTIFILLLLVVFISGTKTITPALNTAPAQLIIQGAVSDTAGPYYVSVLNSVGFYADNSYPGVSGAGITITDSTSGLRDVLTETTTGYYVTHSLVHGIYGHTYLLNVSLNGKTYTASSTMPQPVALDSVTFDKQTKNTIRAQANYLDPTGVVNFYKYSVVINGIPDKRF